MKGYTVLSGVEWSALLCGRYTSRRRSRRCALHLQGIESHLWSAAHSHSTNSDVPQMFLFGRNYACIAIFRQDFTRTLLL